MQTFETPGGVSLQVKLPGGRVVVTTAEEPRCSVELVPIGRRGPDAVDDVVVMADEHRGRHLIRVEQRDKLGWGPIRITRGGAIEVRITCPPGSDLELSGGSTEVRAEGDLGEVSLRTASGDVKLEGVRSRLQVKTTSGDIFVARIERDASLTTVSGDLGVGLLDGSLTVRAVSGDVTVGSVRGPLTLNTTSGDVEVKSVEGGEVSVHTVSGDARIAVGRGTRVWIDAASVSGDLGSELGVEREAPAGADTASESGRVVPIHVKTVSGDVAIVRSAEAFSI